MKNTFTIQDEPKHVYTWYLYIEKSVRRNFRTAENSYVEISVRRKIRTAKIPCGDKSYFENSYVENS